MCLILSLLLLTACQTASYDTSKCFAGFSLQDFRDFEKNAKAAKCVSDVDDKRVADLHKLQITELDSCPEYENNCIHNVAIEKNNIDLCKYTLEASQLTCVISIAKMNADPSLCMQLSFDKERVLDCQTSAKECQTTKCEPFFIS